MAERASKLLNNSLIPPCNIRNVSIIAHVDHGKTSIADFLLASNGLISQANAGLYRFLDSRPDEQERRITMKTCSVSLLFDTSLIDRKSAKFLNYDQKSLVNFLDSPGHADFTGDVNDAVALSEGSLVVVDVVEGICAQTETVMRQAKEAQNDLILVLNKMDRLVIELNLTPSESYSRLCCVIADANKILMDIEMEENIINDEITEEKEVYFNPLKGNVLFTSALHHWGFSLVQLAGFFCKRLSLPKQKLLAVLWGEFYCDFKKKIIKTAPFGKTSSPVFVSLVLSLIWKIYKRIIIKKNSSKTFEILENLGIKPKSDQMAFPTPEKALIFIFSNWIPIAKGIFISSMICTRTPKESFEKSKQFSELSNSANLNESGFVYGVIIKLAKTNGFIAICKLLKGTLKAGMNIHLNGGFKDQQNLKEENPIVFESAMPFLLMGSKLLKLQSVTEGMIFALKLERLFRISLPAGFSNISNMTPCEFSRRKINPLLKVLVKCTSDEQNDFLLLKKGLEEMCICDNNAKWAEESSKLYLFVSGGIHIERCERDLRTVFAPNISFEFSEPLVHFNETILRDDQNCNANKIIDLEGETSFSSDWNDMLSFRLKTGPFKAEWLDEENRSKFSDLSELSYKKDSFGQNHLFIKENFSCDKESSQKSQKLLNARYKKKIIELIEVAFRILCKGGPICREPLVKIFGLVETIIKSRKIISQENLEVLFEENASNRLVAGLIKAFFRSLEKQKLRLVQPFYNVLLFSSAEELKMIPSSIESFGGRIIGMVSRSTRFRIEALVPVYNYSKFLKRLQNKTHGRVSPQVLFSKLRKELIFQDPFLCCRDRETVENFDDLNKNNVAFEIANHVRSVKELKLLEIWKESESE